MLIIPWRVSSKLLICIAWIRVSRIRDRAGFMQPLGAVFLIWECCTGGNRMQVTLAVRSQAAILLAADTTTLAPAADANKMVLVMAPFTPGEGIGLGDLTLATFDGSTPLLCGLGTQPSGFDPATSDLIIDLKPPVTGFRWETTGLTHLPQTIYGYALLNNAGDTVLAADLLPVPQELVIVNQRIDIGVPYIRQIANTMV